MRFINTKCEKCGESIQVWLGWYFRRRVLRRKKLQMLCSNCYFKEAEQK